MDFMVHKKPIKMNNERKKNGQFAKGHRGFKPVGAVKRKSNHELERLREIFDALSLNLENHQPGIGYSGSVELMMKITKIIMQDKKKKKKKPQPQP